jgi:hypothetical protein
MVENPFVTATSTGKSTGCRCHRRVLLEGGILLDNVRKQVLVQITKVQQAALDCRLTGAISLGKFLTGLALISSPTSDTVGCVKDAMPYRI